MSDISDYHWLVSEAAEKWLAEAAELAAPPHRLLERLRKFLTAERARLVVQQTELRRKGVEKFGDSAGEMYFTDLSLQQATDRWIAAYKANRFANTEPITDYCCGIGGDLVALANRAPATGWDRSPEIAIFAEANAHVLDCNELARVRVGNVEDHPPTRDQQWHLDPDRRNEGQRSTHVAWHSPNEATIRSWLETAPHGAIKLAPATEFNTDWHALAELEWISRDRQCRQLIAWFGKFAQSIGKRRATAIHGDEAHSFVGDTNISAEIATEIGDFIFDTDSAIRAARLTSALAVSLDCALLSPGESYLTAHRGVEHPLVTAFRVTEVLPLRVGDLVKHLKACNIGTLEIKTRGVATNPEQVRGKLRLSGTRAVTLLLTKLGKKEIAIVAQRHSPAHLTNSPVSH